MQKKVLYKVSTLSLTKIPVGGQKWLDAMDFITVTVISIITVYLVLPGVQMTELVNIAKK